MISSMPVPLGAGNDIVPIGTERNYENLAYILAVGTYVARDELWPIGPDLLHCKEHIDLLFFLDALKYEISRAKQSTQ